MVSLSHPKTPLSPSSSSPSPSSSLAITMKLKTLIQTLIFSHICRVAGAISKAKRVLQDIFKEKTRNKYRNKILFGSFRLHYNWCSSSHINLSPKLEDEDHQKGLSSYLQWLEDSTNNSKFVNSNNVYDDDDENEIDKLADMFIANCHEKFRLEKIESYRRYQDMLARTM